MNPTSRTSRTPRTDAIRHNIIQILTQYRDGHIHESEVAGFLESPFEGIGQLETELAHSREREERMRTAARGVLHKHNELYRYNPVMAIYLNSLKCAIEQPAATDTTGEGNRS